MKKYDAYLIPNWPAPAHIKACTTTRIDGFSQAPYNAFNLSNYVGDNLNSVEKNRLKLIEDLKLPEAPHWLKQIHSNHPINISKAHDSSEADASYCNTPEKVCIIQTADCLPILLCNQQGTEIAAIHAGWKGLLAGVIDNTVQAMKSDAHNLIAWLGPAIGPKHFELNESIRENYITRHSDFSEGFYQRDKEHWFADFYQLAAINLKHCGVDKIYGGNFCTFEDKHRFYSYRRDKGKTGRFATLVWMDACDMR